MGDKRITFRTDPEDCDRCAEIEDHPCDEHGLIEEYEKRGERITAMVAALADYDGIFEQAILELGDPLNLSCGEVVERAQDLIEAMKATRENHRGEALAAVTIE